MPHRLERAPSGRAKCRACGRAIVAGEWRFGERLPNPYADADAAEMTHWFHLQCAAFKRPEPFVTALDAGGPDVVFEEREWLEQQGRLSLAHERLARVDVVARSPSGRATCRACKLKIEKGAWRIALVWYEDGRFAPSGYIHLSCAAGYLETTDFMDRLQRQSPDLSDEDFVEIRTAIASSTLRARATPGPER
jgi:hypothetical protein